MPVRSAQQNVATPMHATSAGQSPAPETVLRETIRERVASEPIAQPAAPSEKEEADAKSGQVYAPFALPVQPFPKRMAQPAATPAPAQVVQTPAPAATPPKATEDEVLGAFAPAKRPAPAFQATSSSFLPTAEPIR